MNADIITDTTFPHGTTAGYTDGCRGAHCPAPMACRDVHRRYAGDWAFKKQIDAGASVEQILAAEAEQARAALEAERAAREADRAARRAAAKAQRPKPAAKKRPRRTSTGPMTDLQIRVAKLHAMGMTDAEVGAELGKTREQARATRRHLGLPVNPTHRTIDDVRELHSQGLDDVAIAKKLGKETGHVAMLRRKAGLPVIPHPRTKLDRDEMRRLHAAGYTDKQLADHFGVPRHVAQKRRSYLKLTPNKPPVTPGVSHSQETK